MSGGSGLLLLSPGVLDSGSPGLGLFILSLLSQALSVSLLSDRVVHKYLWLNAKNYPHFFALLSSLGNNYLCLMLAVLH